MRNNIKMVILHSVFHLRISNHFFFFFFSAKQRMSSLWQTWSSPLCAFGFRVYVFQFTFSTFFLPAFVDFGRQYLLLWTVYTLFTHCTYIVYTLKNIKNGSHDTIYTFKNYFVTVFSIFNFQFSATISSIQTHLVDHFLLLCSHLAFSLYDRCFTLWLFLSLLVCFFELLLSHRLLYITF